MTEDTLCRSLHVVGLAAWFGGQRPASVLQGIVDRATS
jgi:hypothetical protein